MMFVFAVGASARRSSAEIPGDGPGLVRECRSPSQDDCDRCCIQENDPPGCSISEWTCAEPANAELDWCVGVTPWYNSVTFMEGTPCEVECPACARCSHRHEQTWKALFLQDSSSFPEECQKPRDDCAKIYVENKMADRFDMCATQSNGCSCICEKFVKGLDACPQLGGIYEEYLGGDFGREDGVEAAQDEASQEAAGIGN